MRRRELTHVNSINSHPFLNGDGKKSNKRPTKHTRKTDKERENDRRKH